MAKKSYQKPEIKEVKLTIEDTLLTSCRASTTSRISARRGTQCRACRTTYRAS